MDEETWNRIMAECTLDDEDWIYKWRRRWFVACKGIKKHHHGKERRREFELLFRHRPMFRICLKWFGDPDDMEPKTYEERKEFFMFHTEIRDFCSEKNIASAFFEFEPGDPDKEWFEEMYPDEAFDGDDDEWR